MVLTEADHSDLEPNDSAPTFTLPDTAGEEVSLDDFSDHTAVLLVFTCNHCPYAKAKMPTLNAIADEYDDVAVIGINPNDADEYPEDSFDRMEELVADGTVAYDAYLRDESQAVAAAYGAVGTPDPFLLTPTEDGGFRVAYRGRLDDAQSPDEAPSGEPGGEVRAVIERVRDGERVADSGEPARGCSIKWKPGNKPKA
ncbi:MAG: thioredoxin family protein [Halodesulfurarchaeum sp.]